MSHAPAGDRWLLRDFDKAQPHPLTPQEIDRLVRKKSAGRFLLGYCDGRGAFRIQYVGYAAEDLNLALKAWAGRNRYFKFRVELPRAGRGGQRHH